MTDPSEPADDRPTITPFLGALLIVIAIALAFGLFSLFRDDRPAPEAEVARAAVAQNDALQRRDYADFRSFTCRDQQGSEAEVLGRQRTSVDEHGERYLDDITDVAVDGGRATARVTYYFDRAPDDKTIVDMEFVVEDGGWKVCSPGPS